MQVTSPTNSNSATAQNATDASTRLPMKTLNQDDFLKLLIAQMTANQRTNVAIDEDFDILVDGQPLNTLSGSGKAVANLAIRIGLGQVLTNKVFSVLMGDEVDASMDDDRAGYTAECLERLTKSIGSRSNCPSSPRVNFKAYFSTTSKRNLRTRLLRRSNAK